MITSMTTDIAIKVENLSKCHHIYDRSNDRLKQFILPRMHRVLGQPPKQYFREFWALKNISFEIGKGEAVAIIGRNGSGKSTLLQMICGTLAATSGLVETSGRIAALLELGSGFNPEFSGRENVYLNGALLGLTKEDIDARFDDIAAFADIGQFIDQPIKTYSSGMAVRLAFSIQAQLDPDVLIIDEALSVGDFFFQQKCFRYIRALREKGVTLLFVSHDMGSVRDLCPRVLYLRQGLLQFDGASDTGIPMYFREQNVPMVERTQSTPIAVKKPESASLHEAIKRDAIWIRDSLDTLTAGSLLAVAVYDKNEQPSTGFLMGDTAHIAVLYRPDPSFVNNVVIGITNKYGQLCTATGSYQLGMILPNLAEDNVDVVFDLWVDLLLEAGNYSITVTLGYETGVNHGARLDQTPPLGPLQFTWDYDSERAPFIGQFGLPARADYRLA
jgi:lipopolysaccharide transport system ATP-binding protein